MSDHEPRIFNEEFGIDEIQSDPGLAGDFDIANWIRREFEQEYAKEVQKGLHELVFGMGSMAKASENAKIGIQGLAQMFEGFNPMMPIWGVDELPQKFTPAQFNKLWDGFTEERKIEYVLSLIS